MNKTDAINLLGGTPRKAQIAMGYRSIQAVYKWPEMLGQDVADRVMGAVFRLSYAASAKQAKAA